MSLLTIFSVTACQPTPEKDIIVQKEDGIKEVEEMSVLELIQFLIKNGFGIEEFKINKLENL